MRGISFERSTVRWYILQGGWATRMPGSGANTFDVLAFHPSGRIDVVECKLRYPPKSKFYFTYNQLEGLIDAARTLKNIVKVDVEAWLHFGYVVRRGRTLRKWIPIPLNKRFGSVKVMVTGGEIVYAYTEAKKQDQH